MKKQVLTEAERPVLTETQLLQLRAAEGIEPDTCDIPEAPTENWRYARRFYEPRKEAISLRLDADELDWLRHRSDR